MLPQNLSGLALFYIQTILKGKICLTIEVECQQFHKMYLKKKNINNNFKVHHVTAFHSTDTINPIRTSLIINYHIPSIKCKPKPEE